MTESEDATSPLPRTIARHVLLMIVVLVILTALAVWLGLGPVVHSSA
jgi:hypothetical protein